MRSVTTLMVVLLLSGWLLGEDGPAKLVERLGSPDPETRRVAREGLLTSDSDAGTIEALRGGLSSPNVIVVAACADLVVKRGLRELRGPLVAAIERDGVAELAVRACIRALGAVGDYRDLDLLCGLVARYPDAAEALVSIGRDPGREKLLAAVFELDDPHPAVHYAMASFGNDEGLEALLSGLDGRWRREALNYLRRLSGLDAGASGPEWRKWWRRESLARSLGDPDWERSEEALSKTLDAGLSDERIDDLLSLAGDAERVREVRTKAILTLGLSGESRCEAALLRILQTDEDGMVRVYAAEALGQVASASVAVDLCYYLIFDEEPFRKKSAKGLSEPYYTVDSEVCKALIGLGVAGGMDFMIRQLAGNHRVRVYHQAVTTLRRGSGRVHGFRPDARADDRLAAAGRWRAWFDENRGGLKLAGAAATGTREFRRRVAELVDTLAHFHFLNMSRARETLVLLGETAAPELLAGLARPEMHVRVHCAEILGRIRMKRGRSALAVAASDRKPEVRAAAVAALGKIGPGPQSDVVVRSLEDAELDVRIAAVLALARVERSVAVPAVEAALEREWNQSATFKREVHFTLAAHGDAEAVDWLFERLDSPDTAFRQLVADRMETLTGRNPGIEKESIGAWRDWWRVTRKSYRPACAAGTSE